MSERTSVPEILAQRLDAALPPGKTSAPSVSSDPLVNAAAQLAKLSVPELSAASSRRIEARMFAAFDGYRASVVPRPRRRMEMVLRWALVASLALVLLLSLTPVVAASLPGEPLYSVKQFYEKIELAAAFTPAAKATVYLQHADRRAQEALTLLDRNQFDSSLVDEALANITAAVTIETTVLNGASLRGQFRQIETALDFILEDAEQTGLVSHAVAAPLSQQLEQIAANEPSAPTPAPIVDPTAVPSHTDAPTQQPTPTPEPTQTAQVPGGLPTCPPQGHACQSEGVPGGGVSLPTPRPTHTPRPTRTPRPTNTSRNDPPTAQGNSGGNGNNGNGNGNNENGNNGNGNGNNGNGNNGNGNGNNGNNGNSGGNGNGKP